MKDNRRAARAVSRRKDDVLLKHPLIATTNEIAGELADKNPKVATEYAAFELSISGAQTPALQQRAFDQLGGE